MKRNYYRLPAGVQDLLPAECYNLNTIEKILEKKFTLAGCSRVQSAALEFYDTYAEIKNKIPQKRMFKLTDGDGSLLVLRPDMTLAVARMAAAASLPLPAKLCYFSNVWDYAGTGSYTIREIYQAGVEFLGLSGAFSDAQAIAFAIECLQAIGLKDFIIDVGHAGFFKGILEECALDGDAVEEVRLLVNAKDAPGAQALLEKHGAPRKAAEALAALPTLFGGVEVLSRAEKYAGSPTAKEALDRLKRVYVLLKDFGLEKYVSFDLGTVKDLSYYSGVVFTGLTRSIGSPVLSGGRYDNLADDFGRHVPAVGFAMGLKRILIALERQGALRPAAPQADVVIFSEEGAEAKAYAAYLELTAAGRRVDLSAGDAKDAKNLKNAGMVVLKATKKGVEKV